MKPRPISEAPRDGTPIIIMYYQNDELMEIDIGSWGCVDRGNWETGDEPYDGWLSNDGKIEEPTHFLPMPETPDAVIEVDEEDLDADDRTLSDIFLPGADDEFF